MNDLRAWIASLPAAERDARVDERLGIAGPTPSSDPPGPDLVGHHASGVDAIVEAVDGAPIGAHDVVIDLGSGLGRVLLLVHLLTGARGHGIELQADLVDRARASVHHCGADVTFEHADVRVADLSAGTVFFLYAPFTGRVLVDVMNRLNDVARSKRIVVCALGIDLERAAPWLARRPTESFWLAIYDSPVVTAARGSSSSCSGSAR